MAAPVQVTSGSSASGTNSLALTFGSNITAGNAVIVCIVGFNITSVTGSSDTYSSAVSASEGFIYYVLSSVGGYNTVTVHTSGTDSIIAYAYEVNALTALDKTASSASGSSSWSSGATATTTQANEFVVGIGGAFYSAFPASVTGPSSPWVNEAAINAVNYVSSAYDAAISGYQFVSSTGAFTYSGSSSGGGSVLASIGAVATFKWNPPLVVNISPATVSIAANAFTIIEGLSAAVSPANINVIVNPFILPGLVCSMTATSGTDGQGNAYAAGFTGPLTAFDPSVSAPNKLEAWHNVSPPAGWSGKLRYKILSITNFAVIDFDLTNAGAASPVSLMTMAAQYFPATAWERIILANNGSDVAADLSISTAGVVKAEGWSGNATRIAGTVMYALD